MLSIDTSKLAVARAALDAYPTYVNDVTAFRHEPALAALVPPTRAACYPIPLQGEPRHTPAEQT